MIFAVSPYNVQKVESARRGVAVNEIVSYNAYLDIGFLHAELAVNDVENIVLLGARDIFDLGVDVKNGTRFGNFYVVIQRNERDIDVYAFGFFGA